MATIAVETINDLPPAAKVLVYNTTVTTKEGSLISVTRQAIVEEAVHDVPVYTNTLSSSTSTSTSTTSSATYANALAPLHCAFGGKEQL